MHTHIYMCIHIHSLCRKDNRHQLQAPAPSLTSFLFSPVYVTLTKALQTVPGRLCSLKCKAAAGEAASLTMEGHATLQG